MKKCMNIASAVSFLMIGLAAHCSHSDHTPASEVKELYSSKTSPAVVSFKLFHSVDIETTSESSDTVRHTFCHSCVIAPDGVKKLDWRKNKKDSAMLLSSGICPEDVEEVAQKVDILIISQGVVGDLNVKQETIDYLNKLGKEVEVLKSEPALERYEELRKNEKLVGLLLRIYN